MNNFFKRISRTKRTIANDVDDELRFHLEMQVDAFEDQGLSPEKSEAMAQTRFGNVEKIRSECIQISSRRSVLIWLLNSLFLISLLVGLFLRVLVPEVHVNQVGNMLMMIGGLGVLVVYAKQAGSRMLNAETQEFRIGLNDGPPVGFDESGRTPFDRVRDE
ncbi:MAG TPA: permease prefix domain 1-containing protein [Pyrinomonadaceae bacterium]